MTLRRCWLAFGCCPLLLAAPFSAWAQTSPLSRPVSDAQYPSAPALPTPDSGEPIRRPPPAAAPHEARPPAAELTLEGLIELALASNPTLRQAAARVEVQRGHWVQGGLFPNPNVGYAGFQIGDSGRAGQQGVYLEQPLVAPQKLSLNRATASQDIRRAEQWFAAQRQRVINDVRLRYFDVLYAQRAVEVTRELVRIGQQGQQAAEDLFRGEQVSRIDVLQARVEVHAARINLARAENRHQAAWQELTAVVGAPHLPLAPVVGDLAAELPALEFQATLERIMALSPELAAAEAGLERARFALARARVEPYPDADLQYYPQHDNTTADDIHTVQFYLTVPLFDRNQGNITAAQARLAAARGEVDRLGLELRSRLASAFERYANAQQQTQQYSQSILPDAQESLRLVGQAYASGQIGYLQLLTSQRTYFQATLAYLDSLRDLRQSAAVIDGLLLTGGLEPTSGLD